jgi:hypothetical protein
LCHVIFYTAAASRDPVERKTTQTSENARTYSCGETQLI